MQKQLIVLSLMVLFTFLFTVKSSGQQWHPRQATSLNIGYGIQDNYFAFSYHQGAYKHFSAGIELRYYNSARDGVFGFIDHVVFMAKWNLHLCNFLEWNNLDVMVGYNNDLSDHGLHTTVNYYFGHIGVFGNSRFRLSDKLKSYEKTVYQSPFELQVGVTYALDRRQADMDQVRFRK